MNHKFWILLIVVYATSCSRKIIIPSAKLTDRKATVDYSDLRNWAAHPNKKDPADSVPKPLQKGFVADSTTDVFFIHPTTFLNESLMKSDSFITISSPIWNAAIDDKFINNKTDVSPILYQASIFNVAASLYAPRYRQANYYAYFTADTALAKQAFDFAYEDVKKAFEYYLANYNRGRPVIIAAHSQGTTHAKRLMKEFFDGKPLQNQLVAAYLIGMPVEKNYFKDIPVCKSPTETGCFCSWRTLKEGYLTSFIQKETMDVWVTNPLSWDTTLTPVSRKLNKGAVLLNFNKVLPATTGGRIYNNVLWVNRPKVFGSILLKEKNYHIGDLNLFYVNVRENVKTKIEAFKQLHP